MKTKDLWTVIRQFVLDMDHCGLCEGDMACCCRGDIEHSEAQVPRVDWCRGCQLAQLLELPHAGGDGTFRELLARRDSEAPRKMTEKDAAEALEYARVLRAFRPTK